MRCNLETQEGKKEFMSFKYFFCFLLVKYLSKSIRKLINLSPDPGPTQVEMEMIASSQS